MTLYALLTEGGSIEQYPYDLFNLSKTVSLPDNPSPALLSAYSVVVVEPTPKPNIDHTKNVTEDLPTVIDGKWAQQWLVTDASEEEIVERTATKSASVKAERNRLLAESDWTQLPDVHVDRESWAAYRENLRTIKSQPGFPWEVNWPEPPV